MKRRNLWIAAVLGVVVVIAWGVSTRSASANTSYRFVEVTRADVESTVTATGTLQATETVEVGTQVSGQLAEIYVDFNDRVEEGQLMARIDPIILEQEVRAAQVNVDRNQAELDQVGRDLAQIEALYGSSVVSTSELNDAQYRYALAEAAYRSAEISHERAVWNLQYTEIRAPIDGVVVARAVEVGQTVAASLSAPILFVLAHDLAQMEILASVDESDIGKIAEGQPVHFSVQAYPDQTFEGTVRQVRLEASTQENVVTYSVVIAVDNESRTLLPGMTATLDIVLERVENTLTIPNAALRFQATTEMQEQIVRPEAGAQAETRGVGAGTGAARTGRAQASAGTGSATLWHLDAAGQLTVTRVATGLSDGTQTVILGDPEGIVEGLQVIAAVTTGPAETTTENPFQTQQSGGGPGQRPGSF